MSKIKLIYSMDDDEENGSFIYDKEKWAVLAGDSVSSIGCLVVWITSRQDKDVIGKISVKNSVVEWKYIHKFTENDNMWTMRIDPMISISPDIKLIITEELSEKVVESPSTSLFPINTRTLKVDNSGIPVCQEFLALHSSFFEKLFYQDFAESKQRTVKLDTFTYELVQDMYIFLIVKGKWNLTTDEACSLLEISDFMDSPYLRKAVIEFLKNIQTISLSKLIKVLVVADKINDQEVLECIANMFHNATELKKYIASLPESVSCGTVKKLALMACELPSYIPNTGLSVFFRFTQGVVIVKFDKSVHIGIFHQLQDIFCKRSVCGTLTYDSLDDEGRHKMNFSRNYDNFEDLRESVESNSKYYLYVGLDDEETIYVLLTPVKVNTVGNVIEGESILEENQSLTLEEFDLYYGPLIFDKNDDDDTMDD